MVPPRYMSGSGIDHSSMTKFSPDQTPKMFSNIRFFRANRATNITAHRFFKVVK